MATNQQHDSSIPYDSRAVFAKLIALNTFLESARAGAAAQDFSNNAQSCHALLTTFLDEIKARAV